MKSKRKFRTVVISNMFDLCEFVSKQAEKLPDKFMENSPQKYVTVEGIEEQVDNLKRLKQNGRIQFYVVNVWDKYNNTNYACTLYSAPYDPANDELEFEKSVSTNL